MQMISFGLSHYASAGPQEDFHSKRQELSLAFNTTCSSAAADRCQVEEELAIL